MNPMSSGLPTSGTGPRLDEVEIVVAGAGVVGLALAIALAREGIATASVGPLPGVQPGRTVALLEGSVQLLASLGVWPALGGRAAPLRTMRIVDDTSSIFRGPPVSFAASSIGLEAFGYNVENGPLVAALAAAAEATPGLVRMDRLVTGYTATADGALATLAGGEAIACRLVAAADGAGSVLRAAAGIAVREHRYPQVALTTILRHVRPHGDVSTEFHTRQGPFTLVPLRPGPDGGPMSSLVWVMSPAEADRRQALPTAGLAAAIETQSRGLLGRIDLAGPLGRFPIRRVIAERLTGPRLALVGEAAHALPPIGAQGLNLSLRDAASLVDIVAGARAQGTDVGAAATLERYGRGRAGDIALREAGVHALNMALLSPALPVDAVRGLGLRLLSAVGPLRKAVMREGLRPSQNLPRLMQGPRPGA